jgi:CHAD domain-containing protein
LQSFIPFGRQALSERFLILINQIKNIRSIESADAVHDLRVASRRFHSAAALFNECVDPRLLSDCEKSVRQIRKFAGTVRDTDVQKEFLQSIIPPDGEKRYLAGIERLALRLDQRRKKYQVDIDSALNLFTKSRSVKKMQAVLTAPISVDSFQRSPFTLRKRSSQQIGNYLLAFLAFKQFARQPAALRELHEMRIAAKRLRYVLEIFAPIYQKQLQPFIGLMKSIQDTLGEMHDCDVWLEDIPRFIEKEKKRTEKFFGKTIPFRRFESGIGYFADCARRRREEQYQLFVKIWNNAERNKSWENLSRVAAHVP